jgi:O-antigen/teichoic acid export membrane protein
VTASPTTVLTRLRARGGGGHRHLLTGSSVLVLGAAVQGFGGLAFSVLASKLDVKADFGDATALFTSVLFVTYLAGLGLPVALARYATDRSPDAHVVFTWGVLATVPAAMVRCGRLPVAGGSGSSRCAVGLAPHVRLRRLRPGGAGLGALAHRRCPGHDHAPVEPGAGAHLPRRRRQDRPAPALPGCRRSFTAHLPLPRRPGGRVGFIGILLLPRITGGPHRLGPKPPTTHAAVRYSAINYVSTLAYQAPYFALPVIVLTNVDSATNGSFYVAWGIVAIAFYVPSAIGQALLAEGGKGGAHVRDQMKLAMALAVGLMAMGTVAAFLGKGLVVAVFDESYREAAHILPAMMGAGIPWAITSLLLTEARVLHRHAATVTITITLTVAIIVPALLLVPGDGPRNGLDGASAAWLLGNLAAATVAVAATVVSRRSAGASAAVRDLDPLAPVA